jgi:cytidine deaminase
MSGLPDSLAERLVTAAEAAREHAHAPYSNFAVGAAVIGGSGAVFAGCNVENASYGLSVCAERNAVAAAVAAGEKTLKAMAVVTGTSPPTTPCGACRQVLAEFGDFAILLANPEGERRITSVSGLLPEAFKLSP